MTYNVCLYDPTVPDILPHLHHLFLGGTSAVHFQNETEEIRSQYFPLCCDIIYNAFPHDIQIFPSSEFCKNLSLHCRLHTQMNAVHNTVLIFLLLCVHLVLRSSRSGFELQDKMAVYNCLLLPSIPAPFLCSHFISTHVCRKVAPK